MQCKGGDRHLPSQSRSPRWGRSAPSRGWAGLTRHPGVFEKNKTLPKNSDFCLSGELEKSNASGVKSPNELPWADTPGTPLIGGPAPPPCVPVRPTLTGLACDRQAWARPAESRPEGNCTVYETRRAGSKRDHYYRLWVVTTGLGPTPRAPGTRELWGRLAPTVTARAPAPTSFYILSVPRPHRCSKGELCF